MNRFIVLWNLHMSVAAVVSHNDLSPLFVKNYISEWIHRTNYYNVINCEKSDGFRLAKMLAGDLRLFVSLLDANKPLRITTNKPTTFILQLQCKQWAEILSEAENLNLFRTPNQWLLLDGFQQKYETWNESKSSSHIHVGGIWTFLENLPLLIDSDFKITTVNPNGKISIMSAYKISATHNIIREHLAEWTAEKGLTIFNSASPARRRWNLQGLTLKSSLVIVHPKSFLQMDTLIDRNKDTTSKVTFNVVILFEFLFNMSLQYKIVSDYGIPLKNGSWTGMVGEFQRGVVEIASSPLFPQKNRLSIVEYYAQASDSRGKFIFLSPPLSHSQNVFELPFNRIVWLCSFILFVVSCCFLYITLNCEQFGNGEKTEKVTLSEIMIINVAALCQQGTSTQTWKPAGRIIALVVYLAYMSLYISYSAAIVVIFQSSDTSLQTISDLLKTPIKAGADNASYSQYYFTKADNEIHKKFVSEKIAPKGEPPHFLSPEEGIKKVRNGMYAFHVETSVGYEYVQKTFTEDEKCGLQESKMSFFGEITPWFVMRKNSPYSKLLKIGMRKIIEAGFQTRNIKRFYTQKPKCGSKRSRFVSIGIIDSYFAFLLLGCGISLSIVIMLGEVITKKYFKVGKKLGPPVPYDFISSKDRKKKLGI